MRNKLAFRNARRSMKDYLVYLLTMAAVAALMFAFNSLIFSEDIQRMCSEAVVLTVMLGVVTFFIVLIVAWLINYMAKFMLEKRSREFATYLLIGLKKKELSRLYMTENLLIGTAAFILGMAVGILLQQVIMTVFFAVFSEEYNLHIEMNLWCLLMTVCCYFACYLFALMRNKRVFKKMSIAQLFTMEKKNDEFKIRHEKIRQWLFILAAAYILFVYVMMIRGCSLWMGLLFYGWFYSRGLFFICGTVGLYYLPGAEKRKGNVSEKQDFFIPAVCV